MTTPNTEPDALERCDYLEGISDRIRRGEPVGLRQAIAAIDYQEALKMERENNKWWRKLARWVNSKRKPT